MFCGLNGATLIPRRRQARASPATKSDLPTFEPAPWIMIARVMWPSPPAAKQRPRRVRRGRIGDLAP
jgi:hypothetical protein